MWKSLRYLELAALAVFCFSTVPGKQVFGQEKGLVLEYDFSGGQGSVLKDKSGHGNDGNIVGAQWTKEENGYSLFFNGVDNYVEVKDSPSLQLGDEFTLELLVKPGENAKKEGFGTLRLLIGKNGEFWDANSSFAVYVTEGAKSFEACFRYGPKNKPGQNEVYEVSSPVTQPNTWQKVTLTRTRGDLKIYAGSVVSKPASEKMISSGLPLKIGGLPGRFFQGYIKGIKLYNYAREAQAASFKPKKERKAPYLVMVTSMDEEISSTPLLDVKKETIELLNDSPFNGIAFNLLDIYSGQTVPEEKMVLGKARELKPIAKKDIWVRVNMNRMYQGGEAAKDYYYYEPGWTLKDLAALPSRGLSVREVRGKSTPYFTRVKCVDIYDKEGTLSDFYRIWKLSLKFCRIMNSGIILDPEGYTKVHTEQTTAIAEAQGEPVDEVIRRLREIGARLADIAGAEYPNVPIISLSISLDKPNYVGSNYYTPMAYIAQGMLMRAKEKRIPLKLIEGGENDLGYVNRTVDKLKWTISQRWSGYLPWIERFPDNFALGGTILLWDDASKISGWAKRDAGDPNPFQSLRDFKPFLKELFANYDYIWVYEEAEIDYKPYDPNIAPQFHQKLRAVLDETAKEL